MPCNPERHGDIVITGVESEEVEEINGAYEDLLDELGKVELQISEIIMCILAGISAGTEDDLPELMPSCFPLLLLDCVGARLAVWSSKNSVQVATH